MLQTLYHLLEQSIQLQNRVTSTYIKLFTIKHPPYERSIQLDPDQPCTIIPLVLPSIPRNVNYKSMIMSHKRATSHLKQTCLDSSIELHDLLCFSSKLLLYVDTNVKQSEKIV